MDFDVIGQKIGIIDCAKELQEHLQAHDDFQIDSDDPAYNAYPIKLKYEIYKDEEFDEFYQGVTTADQQSFIKKHFEKLDLNVESSGRGIHQAWQLDGELTLLNGDAKMDCYITASYEVVRGEIVEGNTTINSLTHSDAEVEEALALTMWE